MLGDQLRFKRFYSDSLINLAALAVLTASAACIPVAAQQPGQKTFSSAMEASRTLVSAIKGNDQQALLSILGPDAKDIISSGDDVEDKNDRDQFVQKYQQMHRLVNEPDGKTTLYIGPENWPTPIPLVQMAGKWYFDTAAGKREILYRRIGENELAVIQVCRELVDAEKEYAAKAHDGDSSKHYAHKFFSDPGKHNGLYWQTSTGEAESPIGPLVASAATEGYERDPNQKLQAFHGYYFRMLRPQASTSTTSEADGKSARGFAILAYPAEYRSSGVMTFIVNQDGIVYEKDFGRHTSEAAKAPTEYNQDATWRKAD